MVRKSFRITVCFDLHQVTCPGVWLCPKGKIFVTISLFKCLETTKQVRPTFPLKYHQRFIFDKIFDSVSSLGELENIMSMRNIRMELVQVFKGKLKMITLGVFQAPLTSVLYPSIASGSDSGAAEVDLLFEACKPFPGILSPKAEVSTRAVIEELRLCPKFTEGPVNPTLISSTMKCGQGRSRQRAVCHHRPSQQCTCCELSGNKQHTRPKSTGSRLSPPANSTRCKAIPPPRWDLIEEGGDSTQDSDGYHCEEFEQTSRKTMAQQKAETRKDDSDIQDDQIRNRRGYEQEEDSSCSGTDGRKEDRNRARQVDKRSREEDSRIRNETQRKQIQKDQSNTPRNRQRSKSNSQSSPDRRLYKQQQPHKNDKEPAHSVSPERSGKEPKGQKGLRTQKICVDVHIDPSESDNEQQSQKSNEGSGEKKTSDSDVDRVEEENFQKKTVVTNRDQEVQHTAVTDDPKQICTCGSSIGTPCKKTIDDLMIPWKVYAAPPCFEHCCNHAGKQVEVSYRNNEEKTNKFQRNTTGNNTKRIVSSHTATTQTTGICRCQEPEEFSSVKNKSTKKLYSPRINISKTHSKDAYHMSVKCNKSKNIQNARPNSQHRSNNAAAQNIDDNHQDKQHEKERKYHSVAMICPCGCIDMVKQGNGGTEKRGSIEQRGHPQTAIPIKNCKNGNIVASTSNAATSLQPNVTLRHLPSNYHLCFCPKNSKKR